MRIRQALVSDVDALCILERNVFDVTRFHLVSKRQFRYLLTKGNAEIWVADDDGSILGAAILFFRKNYAYGRLYSIAVDPSAQGGNVGRALFEAVENRVVAKGLKGMAQEVRADNERLLQRYLKIGYTVYGEEADYYPDGASCIKLRRDLA